MASVPEGDHPTPASTSPSTPASTPPSTPVAVARRGARAIRSRWDVLLVIAAGGAVGSLGRWWLEVRWPAPPGGFPWATLVINVTGCALLGALLVLVLEVWPPSRYVRPALGTGVLGGFTTFSTAMAETRALLVRQAPVVAAAYVLASVALGLAAVWLGSGAVRAVVRRMRGEAE